MRKCLSFLVAVAGTLLCLCSCSAHHADRHAWISKPDTPAGESHSWKVRSCKNCLSVQGIETLSPRHLISSVDLARIIGDEWEWEYKGKDYRTCPHEWQSSGKCTVPTRISNGQVVLVRKGKYYGGFMLTAQSAKPDTAQFVWCYRTDRDGRFSTSDSSVKWSDNPKQLENRNGELMIEFGPFEIQWSATGWIYYSKCPGDRLIKNDLAICVTDERTLDDILPREKKWQYRRSPVDG
jgi:hypothetical protein